MQQILILSLISFLFVSCGGSKNTDDWKAPNIYYLRADGNKSVVLTSREDLLLNDYIYVSNSKEQSPDIEGLKKESTELTISSNTKCVADGKSFMASNSYKKSYVQVKEIIPVDATLYSDTKTSCKIQIQIQNTKGSTKTYVLPERTIDVSVFESDFSMKEIVSQTELEFTQISDLNKNEVVGLNCDGFSLQITNSGSN